MNSRTIVRPRFNPAEAEKANQAQWLPTLLRQSLLRQIQITFGSLVIALGILCALALVSYAPNDPSLNTAVAAADAPIQNWLGQPGSYVADMLRQLFGYGSFALSLIIGAWGWRIAQGRGFDHMAGRLVTTLLTLLLFALFLETLFPSSYKNIAPGMAGGAGGLLLANSLGLSELSGWAKLAAALPILLLTLLTAFMACALSLNEWSTVLQSCQAFSQWGASRISTGRAWARQRLNSMLGKKPIDDDDIDGFGFASPTPEKPMEFNAVAETDHAADTSDDYDGDSKPVIEIRKPRAAAVRKPAASARQARLDLGGERFIELPPLDLLQLPSAQSISQKISAEALEQNAKVLETVLADFGVSGAITKVSPGPVVTLYELEPAPGIRASRVIALADDIARSMSAVSVRVAVVPGRNVIGIELPNPKRESVLLRELLSSTAYHDTPAALPLVLGKDIAGGPVIADLARMPHLLVAGTTGSGKSVSINTMILSLLYHHSPQKCRFIMVDPKMLELSVYEGIPHLLAPVVTEPKKAIVALKWTVREMEERYRAMSKLGVRNIEGYNARLKQARDHNESLTRQVQTGFDPATGRPVIEEQPLDLTELPYIVVIVDEMADLMLVAGKEIEICVQRLAQMARAAGIHMIMATQRPSVDVITGTIKANFPTRISFQVTSKIDSRTILGEQGAEQLLGQGDMLFMAGGGRVTRVHGPFVKDSEVESIVNFLRAQGEPDYLDDVTEEDPEFSGDSGESGSASGSMGGSSRSESNELYDKAVDLVLREQKASTSFLQRHFGIGYNKAATLIERMEREGVITTANHVGKRDVLGRKPDDF